MNLIRLALAAALTVVLVLPSVASAQAPALKSSPLQQIDVQQVQKLRGEIAVRNLQIDAMRRKLAATPKGLPLLIGNAVLQPRINTLLRANQQAQAQLDALLAVQPSVVDAAPKVVLDRTDAMKQAIQTQVTDMKLRNDQIAALNQQLTTLMAAPKADAKLIEAMKTQLDQMNDAAQIEMARLHALVDKHNQAFEMITSMVAKFAATQQQIAGNLR